NPLAPTISREAFFKGFPFSFPDTFPPDMPRLNHALYRVPASQGPLSARLTRKPFANRFFIKSNQFGRTAPRRNKSALPFASANFLIMLWHRFHSPCQSCA
ncbi:hypothetical protein, partial [Thalassospira xiamenensis]